MKPHILIVDDEAAIVTLLQYNLEREGFTISEAYDGEMALISVNENPPDLILLDWMIPKLSGIEVCRQLRRKPETREIPVIMLTARAGEGDKIRGLDIGADDYITKPFSLPEMLARIRALLRRRNKISDKDGLVFADISMDLTSHKVLRNNRQIHLGPTEFRLLEFFMQNPGRVFSREELLNSVWGQDIHVEPRTVDVHIRRLRQNLNSEGGADVIRTVRAAGYSLDTNVSDDT